MTTTANPTRADRRAADELDAMADQLAHGLTNDEVSALDDLHFGQAIAVEGAVLRLRQRAAHLRGVL